MGRIYFSDIPTVFRDIVWPRVSSLQSIEVENFTNQVLDKYLLVGFMKSRSLGRFGPVYYRKENL